MYGLTQDVRYSLRQIPKSPKDSLPLNHWAAIAGMYFFMVATVARVI